MPIRFHNADIRFSLKQKRKLQQFIRNQIFQSSHHRNVTLDFIFCSDEYLLDINRRFLKHDFYTDIITFDLSADRGAGRADEQSLVSEIYISVDRVRENADKYEGRNTKDEVSPKKNSGPVKKKKNSFSTSDFQTSYFLLELHRVMFHGVLHLLGYKDKSKKQKEEMRKMEERWLDQFLIYNGQ